MKIIINIIIEKPRFFLEFLLVLLVKSWLYFYLMTLLSLTLALIIDKIELIKEKVTISLIKLFF